MRFNRASLSYIDYKKSKTNIKKKSEQVARLKKKTTTHGSISRKNDRLNNGSLIADPSVQRLMENCSRDLSHQYRTLHENERKAVKKVMTEKRARYCTVVQCLNPIINEEFGMLSEVCQIEDVMHKLMNCESILYALGFTHTILINISISFSVRLSHGFFKMSLILQKL